MGQRRSRRNVGACAGKCGEKSGFQTVVDRFRQAGLGGDRGSCRHARAVWRSSASNPLAASPRAGHVVGHGRSRSRGGPFRGGATDAIVPLPSAAISFLVLPRLSCTLPSPTSRSPASPWCLREFTREFPRREAKRKTPHLVGRGVIFVKGGGGPAGLRRPRRRVSRCWLLRPLRSRRRRVRRAGLGFRP